jgi:hypothetical protein
MQSRYEEPFAYPIGIALRREYRGRNPEGLKVSPTDGRGIRDAELLHVDRYDAS